MLSIDELPESLDIASLARSLFNIDPGNHPSLVVTSNDQAPWTCSWSRQHAATDLQWPSPEIDVLIEVGDDGQNSQTQQGHFSETEEANAVLSVDESLGESSQIVSPLFNEQVTSRRDKVGFSCDSRKPTKRSNVYQTELEQRRKRRKIDTHSNIERSGILATEEERTCQSFRLIAPQDVFLTPVVQQEIQQLSKDKTGLFTQILKNMGSPCLIGGLQDVLKCWRIQENCFMPEITSTVSRAERVRLIEKLDRTKSYFQLLQRHHVLELFKDCSDSETSTVGVVLTSSDFSSSPRKRGNPINKSASELTIRMMKETYPDLEHGTSEYDARYRRISYLRRLGQRLHLLETNFGKGVLGIMLDRGLSGTDVGITDAM